MKCSIEGCENMAHARGWCDKHYARWSRHGDPEIARIKAPNGTGYINVYGYRVHCIGGKKDVLEHRRVMETYLGRPLFDHENVHHKNLQRADNRLENLELWSTSQPIGARTEDLVDWAWEIILRYSVSDPSTTKVS